nr:hypothetical protein CFP56_73947 [Quercus suber]
MNTYRYVWRGALSSGQAERWVRSKFDRSANKVERLEMKCSGRPASYQMLDCPYRTCLVGVTYFTIEELYWPHFPQMSRMVTCGMRGSRCTVSARRLSRHAQRTRLSSLPAFEWQRSSRTDRPLLTRRISVEYNAGWRPGTELSCRDQPWPGLSHRNG